MNSTLLSRQPAKVIALVVAAAMLLATVAFAVAVRAADSSVPVAFIASGEDFPDALGAGSPAALNTGPVLLTKTDTLPQVTQDELTRLNPDKIVIVGGTAAVSTAVETELAAFAPIVERIKGQSPDANRYGTAAEISKAFFPATLPVGPEGPPGDDGADGQDGAPGADGN